MTDHRVLIIEDTESLAMSYACQLEDAGYNVHIARSGAAARAMLFGGARFDTILLDLQLPDCDGLEFLESMPDVAIQTNVIVVTSDGSINRAIAAMRLGAYDFLVKPLAPERLRTTVRNAALSHALAREVEDVRKETGRDHFHGFVGRSRVMQTVYRAIENVATSKATVFVTGESGTGKEVTAEAIHAAGSRKDKPFVAINCGAIPENLLESELFGHVKGAFTGAVDHRPGAARAAQGGTLFLDEICEMQVHLQVKLLRFLQTGMVQPVGSNRAEAVDVRVICATNRDPVREVAEGRFREDLFYRLSVIPIDLPALRDREGDIELIAAGFLKRFAGEEKKRFDPLGPDALAVLRGHSWPGNVRELQNVIRRSVVMGNGPTVILPPLGRSVSHAVATSALDQAIPSIDRAALVGLTLDEIEKIAIEDAIVRAGGNLPAAARALGVSPSTLYRKRERWSFAKTPSILADAPTRSAVKAVI